LTIPRCVQFSEKETCSKKLQFQTGPVHAKNRSMSPKPVTELSVNEKQECSKENDVNEINEPK